MATLKRITLNGVTFYPTSIDVEDVRIADGPERMVDGTLRIWHRAFKKNWKIKWTSLPETLIAAIRTVYRTTTSFTFNNEDNSNATVVSTSFTSTLSAENISNAGIIYYDVELGLEEV